MTSCKHKFIDVSTRQCMDCGVIVPCEHRAPLEITAAFMVSGVLLKLRQCRECKLIGVVNDKHETVWMRAPELETEG